MRLSKASRNSRPPINATFYKTHLLSEQRKKKRNSDAPTYLWNVEPSATSHCCLLFVIFMGDKNFHRSYSVVYWRYEVSAILIVEFCCRLLLLLRMIFWANASSKRGVQLRVNSGDIIFG